MTGAQYFFPVVFVGLLGGEICAAGRFGSRINNDLVLKSCTGD